MKTKNILLLTFFTSVTSNASNINVDLREDDLPYGECPCGRIGMIDQHRMEYYDLDTNHGQTKSGWWPCKDKTHVLKYSQKYGFTEEDRVAKRNGTCTKRKHTECFKREYLAPKGMSVLKASASEILPKCEKAASERSYWKREDFYVWKIEYGCDHKKEDFRKKEAKKQVRKISSWKDNNKTQSWFDGLHGCSNKKHVIGKPKKWCSEYAVSQWNWNFLLYGICENTRCNHHSDHVHRCASITGKHMKMHYRAQLVALAGGIFLTITFFFHHKKSKNEEKSKISTYWLSAIGIYCIVAAVFLFTLLDSNIFFSLFDSE